MKQENTLPSWTKGCSNTSHLYVQYLNPEDEDVNSLGLWAERIRVQSKLPKQRVPHKIQGLQ